MNIRNRALPAMKKIALLSIVLALSGAILFYFYQYSERSQASIDHPVGVFFSTEAIQSNTGDTFTVDIQTSTAEPISIATTIFTYPSNLINFDKESSLNNSVSPCDQFEMGIEARVEEGTSGTNTVILTRGTAQPDVDLPKNVTCFSRLSFTARQPGVGEISILEQTQSGWTSDVAGPSGKYKASFDAGPQIVSIQVTAPQVPGTATATPVPNSSSTPNPTSAPRSAPKAKLTDVKTTILLRLQGITTQPRITTSVNVQIGLAEKGEEDAQTFEILPFLSQGDGTYQAEYIFKDVNLASQYMIQLKGARHLKKNICTKTPTEAIGGYYHCNTPEIEFTEGENTIDLTNISLLAGDIPIQNGLIDSSDMTYIRSNLGSSSSEVRARADLNNDGIVDTQDFSLAIYSLGFKYDEE